MMAALMGILRMGIMVALVLSLVLILLSFGSMPYLPSLWIHALIAASVLLGFVANGSERERGSRFHFLFPWLFGFTLWLILQGMGQEVFLARLGIPSGSWTHRINLMTMFVTGFGFYWVTAGTLTGRRAVLNFVQLLVVLSTLLALYFIMLFFLSPRILEELRGPFPGFESLTSWVGINLQPNHLVDLFFPGLFYAVSLVFYWNSREPSSENPQKAYALTLLNLCFVCVLMAAVLFTKSRGGIMAFLATFFFYFVFFTLSHHHRHAAAKRFVILLAIGGIFLLSLGLKEIVEELQTITDTLFEEGRMQGTRALTMGASWQIIKQRGILGVGLGNFHTGWLLYHRPPFYLFPEISYNDYLWLWAETGILGLVLFAGGILYFLWRSIKTLLKTESYFTAYLMLASAASLLAFSLHALLNPTFYEPPLLWFVTLVLGVGARVFSMDTGPAKEPDREKFSFAKIPVLVLILLLFFANGWLSINKFRAFSLVRHGRDEAKLKQAARLEPFNPRNLLALAHYYDLAYQENPRPEYLEKSLEAMDRAIELNPFQLVLYPRRADLLLKAGDESGVRQTFEMMQKQLPNFYLGELVASAFYMTAAVDSQDPDQASRFEALAIRHYLAARELYPDFDRETTLYLFATPRAVERFAKLAQIERI